MTREESIKVLQRMKYPYKCNKRKMIISNVDRDNEALDMAIQALSSWETYSDKLWKEAYERGKTEALSQEPTEKPMTVDEMEREYEKSKALFHKIVECDDAISRKLAIRAIKNLYPDIPRVDFNGAKRKWADKYAQYIECERLIEQLPSVTQKSGKWIPVSERLPEVGISILVCDADSDIYFTHITRDGVFFDEWGNKIKSIVAWMPLPKPYEPQESEE